MEVFDAFKVDFHMALVLIFLAGSEHICKKFELDQSTREKEDMQSKIKCQKISKGKSPI